MTHLSLFSGIGGLDLAAGMAGIETVGQCEWADYPTRVLARHWPDVPRWRDIRTLTKDSFYGRTGLRTVDVISGGFPCQPFSVAGKRRGREDDRYLWPEMCRVIQEIRPAWVVGENVAGIVILALDQVLADLESIGYAARAFVVPACGVDAPHRRDRVAIVAHTQRTERRKSESATDEPDQTDAGREETAGRLGASGSDGGARILADTNSERCKKFNPAAIPGEAEAADRKNPERDPGRTANEGLLWPAEPGVGRVAHGVPFRVDRLKCLGNAVVPQQFYPIFRAIVQIEEAGET